MPEYRCPEICTPLEPLTAEVAVALLTALPLATSVGELDGEREGPVGGDRDGRVAELAVGQSHLVDRAVEVLQVNHDAGRRVPSWWITNETGGVACWRDG